MKHARILLLVLASVVSIASGIYLGQQHFSSGSSGSAVLTEIELPDIDREIRSGREWLGKIVVVNHWATWCAPCREEIPMLITFQDQMEARGVQVVGIAHDLLDSARFFYEEVGMNYPSMVAITGGNELLEMHGNTRSGALPYTAIFDRSGALFTSHLGVLSYTQLESLVSPLLDRQDG